VRGVGPTELTAARLGAAGAVILTLLLFPLAVAAVRAVLEQDRHGEVTSASRALKRVRRRLGGLGDAFRYDPRALVAVAGVAAVVGYLGERLLGLVTEPVSGSHAWVPIGLARGTVWSAALSFVAVGWAVAAEHAGGAKGEHREAPKLH